MLNLDIDWSGGWKRRRGETAFDRTIVIEADCTGSPNCAAAIHIERTNGGGEEIHLTPDEVLWTVEHLLSALELWKRERS